MGVLSKIKQNTTYQWWIPMCYEICDPDKVYFHLVRFDSILNRENGT